MRVLCWLLVAVIVGCASGQLPDPLAARVWADYGLSGDPPAVTWRRPPALDCGQGKAWAEPALGGECVAGATWADRWISIVAAPPGVPVYATSLAHELNHARLYLLTGNPDAMHQDPSFDPGGLVQQENARLHAELGDATP